MKKSIILLLILSSCIPSNMTAQSEFLEIKEVNRCYYNIPDSLFNEDNLNNKPIVLEIANPKFQLTYQVIDPNEVLEFEGDNDEYFFKIKNPFDEFEMTVDSNHYRLKNDNLLFCLKRKPAEYKKFSKKELIELNYKIPFYELKSNAKIIKHYVRKKPKNLQANEIFFLSENQLNIRSTCINCFGNGLIDILKPKLIEFGYKLLPNDGIITSMSEEQQLALKNDFKRTMSAVKDFQKRNGLEVGQLDLQTIKALGVQY